MKKRKIEFGYPVNIKDEDKKIFNAQRSWQYYKPNIQKYNWVLIFEEEWCTKRFAFIDDLAFCKNFSKQYNKNFFLLKSFKALKALSVSIFFKENTFYCLNGAAKNFYHWHTETLPKILYVLNVVDSKKINFFFPFQLKPYQKKELDLLGINCFFTKTKLSIHRNINGVSRFTDYPGFYDPYIIELTAKKLLKCFPEKDYKEDSRFIYITRGSAEKRKLANEHSILPILKEKKFTIVDFDKIDIEKQIYYSRNAEILISIHGAALTHIMFMKRNSKVLELSPKNIATCYFTLAQTMRVKYFYIMCNTVKGNETDYINDDFLVDSCLFEKTLQVICSHI